jgi:hypothetical protein
MKIVDKRGEVNLSQWMKMVKGHNGFNWWDHKSVGANAYISQTYSPTWASARVWCNRVDGGGIGSSAIFEDLWEANACVLMYIPLVMSPSPLPCTLQKWAWVFWWPFSSPCDGNDKHKEWKSKNACQALMLDGLMAKWIKGCVKHVELWHGEHMGIWWYEWGCGKPRWKTLMIFNDAIHV